MKPVPTIGEFFSKFLPGRSQRKTRAERRRFRDELKATRRAERAAKTEERNNQRGETAAALLEQLKKEKQNDRKAKRPDKEERARRREARATKAAERSSRQRGQAFNVISFPKSGRTWLRLMFDELKLKARYSHDGSGHSKVDFEGLEPDSKILRGKPIVFLYRDPRDTVVSGYFQTTKRVRSGYEGTISDFIRDPRHGIEKIIRFNMAWLERGATEGKFHPITYEALKQDTAGALAGVLQFVGAARDPAVIDTVVDLASFENMQERERAGGFEQPRLKPADPNDPDSYKVREGIVGGHRKHLSEEDVAFCDAVLAKAGYPIENHRLKEMPAPADAVDA